MKWGSRNAQSSLGTWPSGPICCDISGLKICQVLQSWANITLLAVALFDRLRTCNTFSLSLLVYIPMYLGLLNAWCERSGRWGSSHVFLAPSLFPLAWYIVCLISLYILSCLVREDFLALCCDPADGCHCPDAQERVLLLFVNYCKLPALTLFNSRVSLTACICPWTQQFYCLTPAHGHISPVWSS